MLLHNSDFDPGMKHFSLYCVPQEEARDLLEQLHKYQAAPCSLEDVSKLQCRVTELEVSVCVSWTDTEGRNVYIMLNRRYCLVDFKGT